MMEPDCFETSILSNPIFKFIAISKFTKTGKRTSDVDLIIINGTGA